MTNEELVAELKRMREESGLSQRELADRLPHGQGWVNKVETGKRKIDLEVADAWAKACGRELQLHFHNPQRERASQPLYEAAQHLDDDRRSLAVQFLELARDASPTVIDTAIRMLENLRGLRDVGEPAQAAAAATTRTARAR